jgi:hypothetical protein
MVGFSGVTEKRIASFHVTVQEFNLASAARASQSAPLSPSAASLVDAHTAVELRGHLDGIQRVQARGGVL